MTKENFYNAVLDAVKKVWNRADIVETVGPISLKFNQGVLFGYHFKEIMVKGYGRYWKSYCYESFTGAEYSRSQKKTVAKWICRDFDETGRCYVATDEPYDYWNTK